MADKMQRYDLESSPDYASIEEWPEGEYVKYADVASLHADIIEQGRKVQIAASGESKYGAMSDSEFIEWVIGKLEGK